MIIIHQIIASLPLNLSFPLKENISTLPLPRKEKNKEKKKRKEKVVLSNN